MIINCSFISIFTLKINYMEDNKVILFEYTRNGVTYYTPNEIIASMRSEDGKYYSIEYTL